MPKTPTRFDPTNLIGNVLTVIGDRDPVDATTGEHVDTDGVIERFARFYGDGDFDAAESWFWDEHGGKLCDEIMFGIGLGWS